ncbi:hypothetical protein CDD82_7804 [Ophiocordyceps australis]|uniref:Swiss Army Knife RNA repair protein HAD domain-containing protein n=1 Tax=Ophiocordyceps australis TaxID=1399860 RepID=A0A2C5Y1Q5_9HYPO|nr:hypothetical protein CDD82_7804 [Ophiocordyceps australis]
MAAAYSAYHSAANSTAQFTPTALGRWSSINTPLPAVDKIKALHVYDFDNTLFKTPLPNPQVWNAVTVSKLANQNLFINGGWWHDSRILAATGQGLEKEQPRAWQGWWNEQVVELVRLTIVQPDALCVLLTGRSEAGFAELIKKMVASKGLGFDLIGLKPSVSPDNQRFQSTMHFKQLFLNALMETYVQATEIRVYEDRPKHTKGFRDFFDEFNRRQSVAPTCGPLAAEVIQVAHLWTKLDPVVEVAEILQMINQHNEAIEKQPLDQRRPRLFIDKTVFFTGYMIGGSDSDRLKALVQLPSTSQSRDIKFHGDSVVICPRACPQDTLEKVGGLGNRMLWETVAIGCLDSGVWAARVRPVPSTAPFSIDGEVPMVVLAIKKGFRPVDAFKIIDWHPLPPGKTFVFETTVGERAALSIEGDNQPDEEQDDMPLNKSTKRKHGDDNRNRNESRGYHTSARGAARSSSRGRGSTRNAYRSSNRNTSGRGGGRGGGRHYRSLDDMEPRGGQGGPRFGANLAYPPPNQPGVPFSSAPGRSFTQPFGKDGGRSYPRSRGGGQWTANDTDLQNYY